MSGKKEVGREEGRTRMEGGRRIIIKMEGGEKGGGGE